MFIRFRIHFFRQTIFTDNKTAPEVQMNDIDLGLSIPNYLDER